MSSSEPKTTAKCTIVTTKGVLQVELWAHEIPKTCRKFLQLCLNGSFEKCQLNDIDTGSIGLSSTFYTNLTREHNSRLKVVTDGILCWDTKKGTWIVSTLDWSHTFHSNTNIFGKIAGNSIYTFREIVSGEKNPDDPKKYLYPAEIEHIEVSVPYFKDLDVGRLKRPIKAIEDDDKLRRGKVKQMMKVRLSYDDLDGENSEDEGSDNNIDTAPIKMKLPRWIESANDNKLSKKEENKLISVCTDVETRDDLTHHLPINSDLIKEITEPDEVGSLEEEDTKSKHVNSDDISERERETLKVLALFQDEVKDKKILSRKT
ncbi:putative peptidylprolyl isomerase CWC27 NDAI_0E02920 [Naumovozyma dairenensis CBS 421]|uniref:PPIase cyclophilin-type domain-containing protein n=1 Tax=Naumovozyma dairenensis (strain ATCC 10597 / BCRC 20456 / CBS 421 / NBRC 0211 / NRRL Y-12639) TaxID=1071378 RepID=G0WBI9_NAUDC|nr:hypothetical protein NDAI_0E02920 [Naumovozyma dairenensis CBS 421]CCD25109.1 hypothetical protein NDAI_0E02920 [Naumovozyma dairenensis CBS 421]